MLVKEIMTNNVVTVNPDTTVLETAKQMQKYDIGAIPVTNNQAPVGMITDRDILLRCVATGRDPSGLRVSDIMTAGTVTISATQSAKEVAEMMSREQIRRIPVVDNGKVVGIVSIGDVSKIKEFNTEAGSALADICEQGQIARKKK